MARFWLLSVMITLGIVFSVGCAPRATQGPNGECQDTGGCGGSSTGQTSQQTQPRASLPEPPNGTLVFGDQRETGELGGYCCDGVCTEATFEEPPGTEALAVPGGSDLLFEYGGTSPPSKVQARAYALVRGKVERAGEALRVTRAGAQTRIPLEVSPGEYVVELFIRVQGGSVFYYFRVVVGMVTLPSSGGQSTKDR